MIHKAAPYIFMIGIFLVVLDGLWIVDTYDSYEIYPREAYIFLTVGLCLTVIAYMIIRCKGKQVTKINNKITNGTATGMKSLEFVNRIWNQRVTLGNKLVVFLLIILALTAIFDFKLALSFLQPIMFVGMIGISFVYIMKDEDEGIYDDELEPKSNNVRNFLRLIDYRKHPFSVALIIFIIIVLTFLLSKQFGFKLSLETSGNPLYVMSLPSAAFILSGLIFACGFIYLKQHCNFLGTRQTEQGQYKLFQIHFIEIIICGASFLIWLMVLIVDLFIA